MLFRKGSFLFCLIFFSIIFRTSATHIVGGELNYTYLGNDDYQIRLIVYRDCFNGVPPFDNPASIGIFNSNNILVQNVFVDITNEANIPNLINSPCLQPPNNICYEYAEYITTVHLPAIAGGYQLSYQRCCRNSSINNLFNVSNTGATYYATIPDRSIIAVNSNPRFTNLPPTFICVNVPLHFDHSATDADGDSLVYSLCVPLNGGSNGNPMPQPPSSPPYQNVIFQSPYTYQNPLGGVPIIIDPHTGMLTATPGSLGQFDYGICVKEYRNGVYIGETFRDYQVNVVSCPNITVASIFSPTIVCGSLEAHFVNNSYNAITYDWNFGDTTTLNDTSSSMNPVYTYPDTGIYHATLIAHSPLNPLCTDTAVGEIRVFPEFITQFSKANQHCSNEFDFYDGSYGLNRVPNYWLWNFGDGNFSSSQNVVHQYSTPGAYNVMLISSADSGCTDTSNVLIHVLPVPHAAFNTSIDTCHLSASLTNQSLRSDYYSWSFGDNNFSSATDTVHDYSQAGAYLIVLTALTDSGCADTTQMGIDLPALPVAEFSPQHALCDSNVFFDNLSTNAVQYQWDFGDGNSANSPNAFNAYADSGTYTAQLISYSLNCSDTTVQQVVINAVPKASFTHPFSCGLNGDFINQSLRSDFYYWNFGDGNNASDENPVHLFPAEGWYNVVLVASTEVGCRDTAQQIEHILPTVTSLFTPDVVQCNPQVRFTNQSQYGHQYLWSFGDGESSLLPEPTHTFDSTSNYTVRLIVNPGVCADTSYQTFLVTKPPTAAFVSPLGCGSTVSFENTSRDNVYNRWSFGDGTYSEEPNPKHIYETESDANYSVQLLVMNNNACSDVVSERIPVQLPSVALFTPESDTCEATIKLYNQSTNAKNYLWDWGDGNSSTNVNDMHQYYSSGFYNISLVTNAETVCADTMTKTVFAYGTNESHLYIPSAFTPNGDGKNDRFKIEGYNKCLFYSVTIFNRWGEVVFQTSDITDSWDGRYNGKDAEEGMYVYVIKGVGTDMIGDVLIMR